MSQISGKLSMTTIEKFKKKLEAGEIADALALAMSESMELKITTWVSSESQFLDSEEPPPGSRLRTRINILEGEIENEIGSELIGKEAFAELQQLHLEQVEQSREIVLKNLESLQKMMVVLTNTLSELPQSSSRHLRSGEQSVISPSQEEV
jgi:hypothetical protein